ncbi:MAG TPA: hypothetical protein PLZ51_13610 [Aggregatilineales bacterium]|nr:hypothetical protein [Aggregatilineales bacterium]
MGQILIKLGKWKNIALFRLAKWLFNRGEATLNHLKKVGYLPAFYYQPPTDSTMFADEDERYYR